MFGENKTLYSLCPAIGKHIFLIFHTIDYWYQQTYVIHYQLSEYWVTPTWVHHYKLRCIRGETTMERKGAEHKTAPPASTVGLVKQFETQGDPDSFHQNLENKTWYSLCPVTHIPCNWLLVSGDIWNQSGISPRHREIQTISTKISFSFKRDK